MSVTSWTFVTTIVGALILAVLERVLPHTKGQRLFRHGFCNDLLWYTLVQSYVLGLMIYGLIGMIDNELALSRWSLIRDYPVWMHRCAQWRSPVRDQRSGNALLASLGRCRCP